MMITLEQNILFHYLLSGKQKQKIENHFLHIYVVEPSVRVVIGQKKHNKRFVPA